MLELVDVLAVGSLECNCSILADAGGQAVVVDPGDEAARILAAVKAHGLTVRAIVHTHAHVDHVMGTTRLAEECGAETWLHPGDQWLYENLPMQGMFLGLRVENGRPMDGELADGQVLAVGAGALKVLHTPGHTPGSVCFHEEQARLLLSGDTLFRMGIGRTDLWGGSTKLIMQSLREVLMALPADTKVIPGHGPGTTIGDEARANPFINGLF